MALSDEERVIVHEERGEGVTLGGRLRPEGLRQGTRREGIEEHEGVVCTVALTLCAPATNTVVPPPPDVWADCSRPMIAYFSSQRRRDKATRRLGRLFTTNVCNACLSLVPRALDGEKFKIPSLCL